MDYNEGNITMEDVRIIFRNFAGKPDKFNAAGARNFSVLLDDETAEMLVKEGWLVKYLRPIEEGGPQQARLPVHVKYWTKDGKRMKPPRVVLISSNGRTPLSEEEIDLLDDVDIKTVDLIVRPNNWDVNGKTGIKAYLKTIFVTVEEDYLERKYADLPSRGGKTDDR